MASKTASSRAESEFSLEQQEDLRVRGSKARNVVMQNLMRKQEVNHAGNYTTFVRDGVILSRFSTYKYSTFVLITEFIVFAGVDLMILSQLHSPPLENPESPGISH